MNRSNHAVSRYSRWAWHGAILLAVGCSGAADQAASEPGSFTSSSSDLHAAGPRPLLTILRDLHRHVHVRPPHWPHGGSGGTPGSTGSGTGGSQNGGPSSGTGGAVAPGGAPGAGGIAFGGSTGTGTGGSTYVDDPCGDGIQIVNACDDGNTVSGDGCSATCEVEPGYACPTPGQPCRQPRCGDGHQDDVFVPGATTEPAAGGSTGDPGIGGAAGFGTGGAPNGSFYFEQCDDGNTTAGDGCSATCEIEPGYVCSNPGQPCRQPRCGDGYQDQVFVPGDVTEPSGTGGTTIDPGQGGTAGLGAGGTPNGSYYYEQCDDANATSGDGCSATCQIETGYVCSTPGEACRKPICGDGFIDVYVIGYGGAGGSTSTSTSFGGLPGTGGTSMEAAGGSGGSAAIYYAETCDDGNAVSGDGCDAACQTEPGYLCSMADAPCRKPRCGDGIVDYYYPDMGTGGSTSTAAGGGTATGSAGFPGTGGSTAGFGVEQCDDGNTVSGDGCSATCTLE